MVIVFLTLVIIVGGFMWYSKSDVALIQSIFDKTQTARPVKLDIDGNKIASLPIALNNPSVSSAKIHYYIFGTIKEIKTTSEGQLIVLNNTQETPPLVLDTGVRISKITPPYNINPAVPLTVKDLKVGTVIDVSLEYDLNSGVWSMLDVFVSTDRNK